MTTLRIAPLPAAQDAAALALLDQALAKDPALAWYLCSERPAYADRRRAYLASYQRFHCDNRMPAPKTSRISSTVPSASQFQ